jgi:hypothetical protein
MRAFLLSSIVVIATQCWSQGISINTLEVPPHPSAILDVQSTSKGILIPRMTRANRDVIATPATGLLIYQTDDGPGLYMYDGNAWQVLTTSSNVWSTAGNGGTDPSNNFIGTTDNVPLRFRVNNKRVGEINEYLKAIMFGDSAGISMISAYGNIAIGDKALRDNVTGWVNLAIGPGALKKTTSNNNLAIGNAALTNNTTGVYNYAIGNSALVLNATGFYNLAIGEASMNQNVSGFQNVALGHFSLKSNTGQANTAIGNESLFSNATGNDNTSVGFQSMASGTTGSFNTAVGSSALKHVNNIGNTAVGYRAGYATTTGAQNAVVGTLAMENNVAGNYNVAIGDKALQFTNASFNTGVGASALAGNTSGHDNVAVGYQAMLNNITGEYNTAIGLSALVYNVDGDLHIAIGQNAGTASSEPNLNNTIGIGNAGILHAISNQAIIGNSAMAFIGGFQPWTVFSDARMKFDVREDVSGLDFITRLRPVTYYRSVDIPSHITRNALLPDFPHKYDVESVRQTGFLAQEVEAAAIASGYDFSGVTIPRNDHMLYAVSYESFVVPLVKAVQEQQAIIVAQQQQISSLEARLNTMETLLQNSLPKTR